MDDNTLCKVILVDDNDMRTASLESSLSFFKVPHEVLSFYEFLEKKNQRWSLQYCLDW